MSCRSIVPETILAPKHRAYFTIVMAFGRTRGKARQAYRLATERMSQGWSPDNEPADSRFASAIPELPAKYHGSEKYERLYAHAITSLNSLFIRGEGGYTGNGRVPYTTKSGLAIAFFWIRPSAPLGLVSSLPNSARRPLRTLWIMRLPGQPSRDSIGHSPGRRRAGSIMCWSAWHVYQSSHDKARLARVYPGLYGYVNFWLQYHSSSRGLARYFNAGQIADNDARFDRVYDRKGEFEHNNEPLSGFESPDLNAFLVMEMRCLARMAEELGFSTQAVHWRDRANQLAKLIVEFCYFPAEATFYDVEEGTHNKFSGVKTPNMFLPLWAGVPLPESETRRIVEQHMLNPNEFFRPLPFPSLSFDNPKYDPAGYWRGRIWPHFVYWMVQTLWRTGYHKEAELTADRLLDMMQIKPWLMENFNSSPEGIGKASDRDSQPDYVWTNAAAIELLLERYKDPPPAP
ncbi:MAG: trehalase family glycosidase [Terriglobia bacterium]